LSLHQLTGERGEGRHSIDVTENIVLSSLIFLFLA
jgi:hypothetical protein